jgi:hypothetical protein
VKRHVCPAGRKTGAAAASRRTPAVVAPDGREIAPGNVPFMVIRLVNMPTKCVRATGDPVLREFLGAFLALKDDEGIRWPLPAVEAQRTPMKNRIKGYLKRNEQHFSSRSDDKFAYFWKRR